MRWGRDDDAVLAISLTELQPGETVLDVGCGPGVAALRASRHGAVVTGVDPSDVMRRVAARSRGGADVTWLAGSAEDLPVAADSQDVAWGLATVHHWPDLDGALAEILRALRPGGRFLAVERRTKPGASGHASHGWTDAQARDFTDLCAGAGFLTSPVSTHRTRRGTVLAVLAWRPS